MQNIHLLFEAALIICELLGIWTIDDDDDDDNDDDDDSEMEATSVMSCGWRLWYNFYLYSFYIYLDFLKKKFVIDRHYVTSTKEEILAKKHNV